MTTELVVARYLEDLSWLNNIPPQISARVYDKSPDGNLPNIGREAHTYLHHICESYDNLADLTIFTKRCALDAATAGDVAASNAATFGWLGHIIDDFVRYEISQQI